MSERYDNIEQLDQLRKSGAINEGEYEKEKERILRAGDAPQKTIIETREKSSFGSIVFGGLVLFAVIVVIYVIFTRSGANQTSDTSAEVAAPQEPVFQGNEIERPLNEMEFQPEEIEAPSGELGDAVLAPPDVAAPPDVEGELSGE